MYFPLIYNSAGTGYLQELKGSEESIFAVYKESIERWRKEGLSTSEVIKLNQQADQIVLQAYKSLSANK
ncbi:MAG: hypothetical protein HGA52_08365, partial [Bacteroidales bacterium]|nr:hypothetical protein [Bacteroidales bacterium]